MRLLPVDTSILDELGKQATDESLLERPKQKWSEKIIGKLYSMHPFLHGYNMTITFKHINSEDDHATGAVTLSSGAENFIYVPFVISSGEVQPLDIMSDGSKYHYLTEERVRTVLDQPVDEFQPAGRKPFGSGMAGVDQSDTQENFTNPREFLDKVSRTLSGDVVEQRLRNIDKRAYEYWCGEYPEVGEKVASTQAELLAERVERSETEYVVSELYADGSISKQACIHAEATRRFGALPESGTLTRAVTDRRWYPIEELELEKLSTDGMTACRISTDYGERDALVVKDVYNLFGERSNAAALGDGFYISQGPFYGGPSEKLASAPKIAAPQGRGVFVFEQGVTEPVEVRSSYIDGGTEKFSCRDKLGFPCILQRSDILVPQGISKGRFLLPKEAQFVPIGEEYRSVPPQQGTELTKLSCYGNYYSLSGANQIERRPYDEMELTLVGLGCQSEQAQHFLKTARVHGSVELPGLPKFAQPERIEFLELGSSLLPTAFDLRSQMEQNAQVDFIKEAIGLIPSETVDTALGLQLASPTLHEELRRLVPTLEKTQDRLVELLMLSRLGTVMQGQDATILRVVKGMESIMKHLRLLEAGV